MVQDLLVGVAPVDLELELDFLLVLELHIRLLLVLEERQVRHQVAPERVAQTMEAQVQTQYLALLHRMAVGVVVQGTRAMG